MPNLLSKEEFTERFRESIDGLKLDASCKEALVLELHYGSDEPVLTLSLKEVFARYEQDPENIKDLLAPYIQDLVWTVRAPRYSSRELFEKSIPSLRNFYLMPPNEQELGETENSPKGPLVFEQVLKTPREFVVMQFNLLRDGQFIPLCKGDTLPCIPDSGLMAQLALHNLALIVETASLTATPLQFESLKARSWLVGIAGDEYKPSVAALSCIPAVMASLENTFKADNGLIAVIPAQDQLIVSVDTDDESVVELGVLAQELVQRAPNPLSAMVWKFKAGNLEAVQALDLQEMANHQEM